MINKAFFIVSLLLLYPVISTAAIYTWKDDSGTVHISDNPIGLPSAHNERDSRALPILSSVQPALFSATPDRNNRKEYRRYESIIDKSTVTQDGNQRGKVGTGTLGSRKGFGGSIR